MILSDLIAEASTARALNTALAVERDQFAERIIFFQIAAQMIQILNARQTVGIGHRLILQHALAALITDGAIERMIGEQKFKHRFTHFYDRRRLGEYDHAL